MKHLTFFPVETGADGYKRVSVRGLEALMVEALRELQQKQDSTLAKALKRRDAENAELKARLEKLERLITEKNEVRNENSRAKILPSPDRRHFPNSPHKHNNQQRKNQ